MSNKTKFILIGRSFAGKTTLCQRIYGDELVYHKTQTIQIVQQTIIDTPGEYLERRFRSPLQVASVDADIIVFVQSAIEDGTMFPPAYKSMFAKPCLGIISKCDIATGEQIARAHEFLLLAGAEKIFKISSITGEGVDEFLEYLGTYQ